MSAKRNLLIGVGVGAVLGILFAPHKGSKTRKKIRQRGRELHDGWNNLKDTVDNTFTKTSDAVDDIMDESIETISYVSSTSQDDRKV